MFSQVVSLIGIACECGRRQMCKDRVERGIRTTLGEMAYAGQKTGGKVLADRSLSRLLKDDWPKTIDELERDDRASVASGAPARHIRSCW